MISRDQFLTWVDDVSPAGWIVDSLHGFSVDVGSVLPPVFEAYARVFHPATAHVGPIGPGLRERDVSWREIAEANRRVFHPEVQFGHLVGSWRPSPQPGLWDSEPRTGTLPRRLARRLAAVLAPLTATSDACWFAAWIGLGGMSEKLRRHAPRIRVPQREYFLARAPISAAEQSVTSSLLPPFVDALEDFGYQSASLWWPDDRAWCVATEVDFAWTYVGGSKRCIDAVLSAPGIESLPAKDTDKFHIDDDRLNPAPPGDWR